MARQGVSTGTTPNDGTGDSLLAGAVKINSNFSEVYGIIGDGTNAYVGIVTQLVAGSNISISTSHGSVTVTSSGSGSIAGIDTTGTSGFNGISVSGVSTFSSNIVLDSASDVSVTATTGNLNLTNTADDKDIKLSTDNGSGDTTTYILCDGSTGEVDLYYYGSRKLNTSNTGVTVTGTTSSDQLNISGISTFNGKTRLLDDVEFHVGTNGSSGDYKFYRDSGNTLNILYEDISGAEARFIGNVSGTGNESNFTFLKDTNSLAKFTQNGILLYANNSEKFRTNGGGVNVTGNLDVTGISTFSSAISVGNTISLGDDDRLRFGAGNDLQIYHNSVNYIDVSQPTYFRSTHGSGSQFYFQATSGENSLILNHNGSVDLYYDNSKKFETVGTGVTVFGTAQTQQLSVSGITTLGTDGGARFTEVQNDVIRFKSNSADAVIQGTGYGALNINSGGASHSVTINTYAIFDGANGNVTLNNGEQGSTRIMGPIHATGIASFTQVNVSGIVTAFANAGIATFFGDGSNLTAGRWLLGANGTNHYTFTGPGGLSAADDPTIYLARGQRYEFVNEMGAHPFRIQSTSNGSTGTAYNVGVTNNDVSNGTLIFEVPFAAPNTLYYQCTSHGNMGGSIIIYPSI